MNGQFSQFCIFLSHKTFFNSEKNQHNTQISISEYFPLFGRTHLLFASITTAWRDDSAMNDSHQHGRSRRQFSILQQKAGTREEETYVCSFHRYYQYHHHPYAAREANLIFRGLCPSSSPYIPPFGPPCACLTVSNL